MSKPGEDGKCPRCERLYRFKEEKESRLCACCVRDVWEMTLTPREDMVKEHEAAIEALKKIHHDSFGADGAWIWQGDGADDAGSLTCPVLITADQLRKFLSAAKKLVAMEEKKEHYQRRLGETIKKLDDAVAMDDDALKTSGRLVGAIIEHLDGDVDWLPDPTAALKEFRARYVAYETRVGPLEDYPFTVPIKEVSHCEIIMSDDGESVAIRGALDRIAAAVNVATAAADRKVASQGRVLKAAGFDEAPKTEGEYMNMIECGLPPKAVRMLGAEMAKTVAAVKDRDDAVTELVEETKKRRRANVERREAERALAEHLGSTVDSHEEKPDMSDEKKSKSTTVCITGGVDVSFNLAEPVESAVAPGYRTPLRKGTGFEVTLKRPGGQEIGRVLTPTEIAGLVAADEKRAIFRSIGTAMAALGEAEIRHAYEKLAAEFIEEVGQ